MYTVKELEEFNEKSETRRKQMKAQRQRVTYDTFKISEVNKRNYNASKRRTKYLREKEDSKRFKPDEEKARNIDKEEFEEIQTKRTSFLSTRQKNIFLSALKE